MKTQTSLKRALSTVRRFQHDGQYRPALDHLQRLLAERPDNAQLLVLRARLTQLQDDEDGTPTLEDARADLEKAAALDDRSPGALIELGYFLYAVEDDAKAASKVFEKALRLCRELLKEALLGQAGALEELGRDADAFDCLAQAHALATANGHANGGEVLDRFRTLRQNG